MLAGFTKCVVEVETGNGLTGIAEAPGPASARLSDSVSPVLVGAPASDSLVDPERNSAQLARRLREAGAPVIHRRYERANHITLVAAFAAPLRWIAPVLDDMADFARDPSRAVASASG